MGAMDTPKQVDCHISMSTMCQPIHMRERTLYSSYRLLGTDNRSSWFPMTIIVTNHAFLIIRRILKVCVDGIIHVRTRAIIVRRYLNKLYSSKLPMSALPTNVCYLATDHPAHSSCGVRSVD